MRTNLIVFFLLCLALSPTAPGLVLAAQGAAPATSSKTNRDAEDVRAMADQARESLSSDPKVAILLVEEILDALTNAPDPTLKRRANSIAAHAYSRLGDYDAAIEFGERAIFAEDRTDIRDEIAAFALDGVARAQTWQGRYDKALKNHQQAYAIRLELGDEKNIASSLEKLATLYTLAGEYDKAGEFYEQSLAILQRFEPSTDLKRTLLNAAWAATTAGQPEKALTLLVAHNELLTTFNTPIGTMYYHDHFGDALMALGRFEEAEPHIEKSLTWAEKFGAKEALTNNQKKQARIYFERGDFKSARTTAEQTLQTARATNDAAKQRDLHFLLSQIDDKEGRTAEALAHYKMYVSFKDDIFNTESTRRAALLRAEFDLDQKEREITVLQRDREIQSLRLEREGNFRNSAIFAGIAAVLVACGLALGLRVNIRAKRTIKAKAEALAIAQERLQKTNMELERVSKLKSDFLSMTSHELRTPLNGVLGMLQVLELSELDQVQREYLDVIRDSGELMLAMLNDILDLAKIEAGKLDINPKPFELKALTSSVSGLWSPKAQDRGLTFSVETDADAPQRVVGDAHRIQQVLNNFTSNALKFTREGGVILRVCAQAQTEDKRVLLHFEVEDTGVGISEETQAKLFKAFSQADSDTAEHYGGTGLGLAICLQLVRLMKGEIGVRSVAQKGSTFWFTLPLQTDDVLGGFNRAANLKAA